MRPKIKMCMKRFLYLYLLASVVLLASCIKENYDDCERCTLTFSYTGDVTWDIFPEQITRVNLYVFDNDDRLVQTKLIEQNELKAFQGTKLNLGPGKYRVVGVGNGFNKTEVTNTSATNMAEIQMQHPNLNSGGAIEGNDSLYLGQLEFVMPKDDWYEDDVPFRSSHLKVSYKVEGYFENGASQNSSTRAVAAKPDALELRVKNLLPQTDFTNTANGNKTTYNPTFSLKSGGVLDSYFNIMRHSKDSDVEFELVEKSTGNVLNTLALKDFLTLYPQIDVTKQEVLIPIVVKFTSMGVTVTIPDWLNVPVTPDFS